MEPVLVDVIRDTPMLEPLACDGGSKRRVHAIVLNDRAIDAIDSFAGKMKIAGKRLARNVVFVSRYVGLVLAHGDKAERGQIKTSGTGLETAAHGNLNKAGRGVVGAEKLVVARVQVDEAQSSAESSDDEDDVCDDTFIPKGTSGGSTLGKPKDHSVVPGQDRRIPSPGRMPSGQSPESKAGDTSVSASLNSQHAQSRDGTIKAKANSGSQLPPGLGKPTLQQAGSNSESNKSGDGTRTHAATSSATQGTSHPSAESQGKSVSAVNNKGPVQNQTSGGRSLGRSFRTLLPKSSKKTSGND
ncbi:hypothetical protein FKP32DRAFT_787954 [Trametes sanguinea]|nr:hypothetical protein FKP32DRAFT_787954 [Trametes sanguinea]